MEEGTLNKEIVLSDAVSNKGFMIKLQKTDESKTNSLIKTQFQNTKICSPLKGMNFHPSNTNAKIIKIVKMSPGTTKPASSSAIKCPFVLVSENKAFHLINNTSIIPQNSNSTPKQVTIVPAKCISSPKQHTLVPAKCISSPQKQTIVPSTSIPPSKQLTLVISSISNTTSSTGSSSVNTISSVPTASSTNTTTMIKRLLLSDPKYDQGSLVVPNKAARFSTGSNVSNSGLYTMISRQNSLSASMQTSLDGVSVINLTPKCSEKLLSRVPVKICPSKPTFESVMADWSNTIVIQPLKVSKASSVPLSSQDPKYSQTLSQNTSLVKSMHTSILHRTLNSPIDSASTINKGDSSKVSDVIASTSSSCLNGSVKSIEKTTASPWRVIKNKFKMKKTKTKTKSNEAKASRNPIPDVDIDGSTNNVENASTEIVGNASTEVVENAPTAVVEEDPFVNEEPPPTVHGDGCCLYGTIDAPDLDVMHVDVIMSNFFDNRVCTAPPRHPRGNELYIFKTPDIQSNSNEPWSDWRFDGYIWFKKGYTKKIVHSRYVLERRYHVVMNYNGKACRKFMRTAFWCNNGYLVVYYHGDASLAKISCKGDILEWDSSIDPDWSVPIAEGSVVYDKVFPYRNAFPLSWLISFFSPIDSSKISSVPPFRPNPGEIYVYRPPKTGFSMQWRDWSCDGYKWVTDGRRNLKPVGTFTVQRKVDIAKDKDNKSSREFKRIVFKILGKYIVVIYIGDASNAMVWKRTLPSLIYKMKQKPFSKPSQVFEESFAQCPDVIDEDQLGRLTVRSKKQVCAALLQSRREKLKWAKEAIANHKVRLDISTGLFTVKFKDKDNTKQICTVAIFPDQMCSCIDPRFPHVNKENAAALDSVSEKNAVPVAVESEEGLSSIPAVPTKDAENEDTSKETTVDNCWHIAACRMSLGMAPAKHFIIPCNQRGLTSRKRTRYGQKPKMLDLSTANSLIQKQRCPNSFTTVHEDQPPVVSHRTRASTRGKMPPPKHKSKLASPISNSKKKSRPIHKNKKSPRVDYKKQVQKRRVEVVASSEDESSDSNKNISQYESVSGKRRKMDFDAYCSPHRDDSVVSRSSGNRSYLQQYQRPHYYPDYRYQNDDDDSSESDNASDSFHYNYRNAYRNFNTNYSMDRSASQHNTCNRPSTSSYYWM